MAINASRTVCGLQTPSDAQRRVLEAAMASKHPSQRTLGDDPDDALWDAVERETRAREKAYLRDYMYGPPPGKTSSYTPCLPDGDPQTTEVVDLARSYIAPHPALITGQGGRAGLWRLTMTLVHGFCLSAAQALPLLQAHPATPPWSQRELEYTIRRALLRPPPQRGLLRDRGLALKRARAPRPR
jgi:hypothetical protein